MRVIIDMEVETNDYGGKEFRDEIEALINDIDCDSKLTRFKMCEKFGTWNEEKDIDWQEE